MKVLDVIGAFAAVANVTYAWWMWRKASMLETVLAARIESEEEATAKAYCDGWAHRGIF